MFLFVTINNAETLYTWDWQFFVRNNSNQPVGNIYIVIYSYNRSTETISAISSGYTASSQTYNGANAALEMIETNEIPEHSIAPNITPAINRMQNYVVRVDSKYIWITHNGSDDITFYYNTETYSLTTNGSYIEHTPGVGNTYNIKLKNDYAGGAMYLSNIYESSIPLAGRTISRADYTFPHSLTAAPGLTGTDGYKRVWKIWSDSWSSLSRDLTTAQNYTNYEAQFWKEYNLTFLASGSMYINGSTRSSGWTEYVQEQISITAYANSFSSSSIDYTFLYWTSGGQSYYSSITASDTKTYTAVYSTKPNNSYRLLSFNTNEENNPIEITWSKHPLDNSDVTQYAVYRKVTTQGTPELLTTISANGSSTYTYTDCDYAISSGDNKILLFYDVRAYYSPSSAYSDPYFEAVYGIANAINISDNIKMQTSEEVPTEYSISNYPNPFNPTTTIDYQLPKSGFVTLKVYDMLGKEVATLVNESKASGYYKVNFNASKLSSGIYVYKLTGSNVNISKKMILMK
jgi:hypothetical protein